MVQETELERLPDKYYRDGRFTQFFYYRLYTVGKAFFKERIIELDTEHIYTRESVKEKIDEDASAKLKGPYVDRLIYADEKWYEYRNSHLNEFDTKEVTDSLDDFTASKSSFIPNHKFTLQEAVIGYLICNEQLDEIDKSSLPKYTKLESKKEFAEKHKAIRKAIRKELEIPDEEELQIKHVVTGVSMKPIGKKNRPDTSNTEVLDIFKEDWVEFLCD